MTPQAQLIIIAWMPFVIYLFYRFPSQKAVIISFIIGTLFLPQKVEFPLPLIPDYTSFTATNYSILIATCLYDLKRFKSYKFGWLDLPMIIWCLCPFWSSISNGLGAYDGLSASLLAIILYGVPYFLGRIYLNNLAGLRLMATGILIGGLIYVPLCLYEIRMSPQLHRIIYGYFPHSFAQTIRYGGYRPQVFMQHGLEVGVVMMAATLIGIWLWKTGAIRQIYGIPVSWLVSTLLMTFVLVKSTGAYFLLLLGIAVLYISCQFRTAILIVVMILSMSCYLAQNALTESYISDQIISSLENVVPQERLASLEFRFNNEELLVDKAREKIVFGWGGWGRNKVYDYNWDDELVDITITDSLWIIAFGEKGLIGLSSLFLSFFLPVIGFVKRYPTAYWLNRKVAPAAVSVVVIMLYALDCLFNAMVNPNFILACGGIAGLALQESKTSKLKTSFTESQLFLHQLRSNHHH